MAKPTFKLGKGLRELLKPYLVRGWALTKNKHFKLTAPSGHSVSISTTSASDNYLSYVKQDLQRLEKKNEKGSNSGSNP